MKTIGLTGGIACGKSSVSNIVKKMGIQVVSSDELAHQVIEPGGAGYSEVIKAFGTDIIGEKGQIDRKKLGTLVFSNADSRKLLETIIHPKVIHRINEIINFETKKGRNILVVEVPLLFEAGLTDIFDEIWVVSTTMEEQLKRLMERDHLSRENAIQRMNTQLPLSYKEAKADVVIHNNQDLSYLEEQVKCLLGVYPKL